MAAAGSSPGYASPSAQRPSTSIPQTNPYANELSGSSWGGYSTSAQPYINNSAAGQAYTNSQQTGPYRGGLLTNYSNANIDQVNAAAGDSDTDVAGAAAAEKQLEAEATGDTGVSGAEQQALLNMYEGRIGQKNALASQIQAQPGLLNQEQNQNKAASGSAIGQGLKETNQNFNNRGLLYSGNRVAGDQQVQNQGAATLASNMAGTAQDSANSLSAAESAYSSVDLASAQQQLTLANNAFSTASANNIARLQAMQQLGSGVGAAVGTIAGNGSTPSAGNPTSGWQPQQLQSPTIGQSYGGSTNYMGSITPESLQTGN